MNNKALRILEYQKIIEELVSFATSEIGKSRCRKLRPSSDYQTILSSQEETRDALTRIYKKGSISFSGLTDVRPSLKRVEIGASLTAPELLAIARILEISLHATQYGQPDNPNEEPDSLTYQFESLAPLTPLCHEIKRCIISDDEMSDDASPALKDIRRSIKQMNAKIHSQLSSIISGNDGRLQDSIITMRNGRYCVPVKAEYRSHFPGMIHDQSATGSTLFIEPMSVVNLNNELKELEGKEQTEIDRILAALSEQVGFERDAISLDGKILSQLDFIFAKASYAKSYRGTEPLFNQDGILHIKQGRHPLIDKKKVVPIDITLGETFSMLIVTGPNTGGKTVSLKTVGLFTLMGQAGLHIPAADGSRLSVFDQIYADIGDEQSIEQNLSTFSSHMTSIVDILNKATPKSLVLFDELCGGTDPIEGAALAIAILTTLHNRGVHTMATTHYSELKHFALATAGIENACCEFDVATLSPTYRLMIGIPGKSNAFAISSRLGLSEDVIRLAESQLSTQNQDFEAMIADLEEKTKQMEEDRKVIERTRGQIELLKAKLDEKQENIDAKRAKLMEEARQEAREIIENAKNTVDKTIRRFNQINKQLDSVDIKEMEADRTALGKKMKDLDNQQNNRIRKSSRELKPEDLHIGDTVYVLSMNVQGTVSTLPNNKGMLYVQMGILRSQVSIKDIDLIDTPKPKTNNQPQRKNTYAGSFNKSSSIRPEINLLGCTVDEAIPKLEKFLDDAYLSHLTQVTIIHGKGTGALRNGIHMYLKKQKYVKSYRAGLYGEGEAGVTVVSFVE